jgi:peptidoglycan/LPS O-acetylase OafA/YrhL
MIWAERRYVPGIDGLRAIAVLAVLAYHTGGGWMPGGFLGVEVFFVISGYLITVLLLHEQERTGTIDLGRFWLRRARRLLPALFVLIAVVLAFVLLALPEEVVEVRADALAALFYVQNWHLIFAEQSYFETLGRPSLLRHLWSLAVEEQFYLIWPPILVLLWRFGARRAVLFSALLGALAASTLMALLHDPNADPSRVYYGTDTRASGLLIGAALACLWQAERSAKKSPRSFVMALDLAGLSALLLLVTLFLSIHEFSPLLYRGGFLLIALTTALLIVACAHPAARLCPRVLGGAALGWVGTRSYSIYLWHWPIFMVSRPLLDMPIAGVPLLLMQLLMTLGAAEMSYRHVEQPFRNGALTKALQRFREARGQQQLQLVLRWGGSISALMLLALTIGLAATRAEPPPPPVYLAPTLVQAVPTVAATTTMAVPTPSSPLARPFLPELLRSRSALAAILAPSPIPLPTSTPPPQIGPVYAVGDSVLIGVAGNLATALGNVEVDAEVGRQAGTIVDILRWRREAGLLPPVVLVHAGTNGYFSPEQFDTMMSLLRDVPRVVVVNVKVPRSWESPNNAMIAESVGRYPNVRLVDWYAASAWRGDFFYDDGYHPTPAGATTFADLVRASIEQE